MDQGPPPFPSYRDRLAETEVQQALKRRGDGIE